MSSWRAFPDQAWSMTGEALSGFGKGEGSYGAAYAIDVESGPFLNGRVSATLRLAGDRAVQGAGVVARADELRSFAAFYVVTDEVNPDRYSVRIGAFKYGKLISLRGLKNPIAIEDQQLQIALQFFSGEMVGEVLTGTASYTLKAVMPEPPFPGYCGVIRFYNASAVARNLQIERITMKPILPEEDSDVSGKPHELCVFLAHTSADKAKVLQVAKVFRESGITYWVDHEQIRFGDGIVAKIEDGLQKSKYVVVCLSEQYASSGWCRAEYGPILYREFSGDTSRRVIPLSLDGSKNLNAVPLLLSDKMRADFTDDVSFKAFIRFLRESGA